MQRFLKIFALLLIVAGLIATGVTMIVGGAVYAVTAAYSQLVVLLVVGCLVVAILCWTYEYLYSRW